MPAFQPPPSDCPKCLRLCGFRHDNAVKYPDFFNAPVPSFGQLSARLLVVGLAPGLKGANRTGRPFTGDYAGLVLYPALLKHGFAQGEYKESVSDGLALLDCRITNAVRCVPPENKPKPSEIKHCNGFLRQEIQAMPNVKCILSLGLVSHNAVLKALGIKASRAAFAHGAVHRLTERLTLIDSYHCSRYNINTGRLTEAMFDKVMARVREVVHHNPVNRDSGCAGYHAMG